MRSRFRRGVRFRGSQPTALKILKEGTARGRELAPWVVDVVGGWSEDLDGCFLAVFFWKILSRQSLQHSFQWMICHELVFP